MIARQFRFVAITREGKRETAFISATTPHDAMASLSRSGRTVLSLEPAEAQNSTSSARVSREDSEIALVQLATMARAGIGLLEALSIIAESFKGRPLARAMVDVMTGLRRGDSLSRALRNSPALGYPPYVHTLVETGEASGQLPAVLEESARRLEAERTIARDFRNALVYPAFLLASGGASVSFLLYTVVPKFAAMLEQERAAPNGLSAFVINAGVWFHANAAVAAPSLVGAILLLAGLSRSSGGQAFFSAIGWRIPVVGSLLVARQRASWARTMALAIGAGVDIIRAGEIAAGALSTGPLKNAAFALLAEIRRGTPLDAAFLEAGVMTPVDAGLIRAGQRSGQLGAMMALVAVRSEEKLRGTLKRFTLLAEPIAIATVAGVIGAIIIGLVSALLTLYDSVG